MLVLHEKLLHHVQRHAVTKRILVVGHMNTGGSAPSSERFDIRREASWSGPSRLRLDLRVQKGVRCGVNTRKRFLAIYLARDATRPRGGPRGDTSLVSRAARARESQSCVPPRLCTLSLPHEDRPPTPGFHDASALPRLRDDARSQPQTRLAKTYIHGASRPAAWCQGCVER